MIGYTREAAQQVDDLRTHYEGRNRLEALRNLAAALNEAESRIERDPGAGLPAPRPYPVLSCAGRAWMKAGRYWIAYSLTSPPVILGVFFDAADIPRRI